MSTRPRTLLAGTTVAAALASTVLAPTPASAGIVAPPDKIVIEIATVNGSGCPQGTAAVAVAPDNTAFTVTYSDYLAQVGVGSKPTDFRKNCQLNLIVHVPGGFTYAVASADYRGYAKLEPGATAVQKASYYFQGSPDTAQKSHPYKGPYDNNWQATDQTDWGQLVWAPCGVKRNFNINTELRVSAGTSDPTKTNSFIAMDSTDGDIRTVYRLAWKECPPK
ncbi:DUF4360 domain-containing protein [Streptomyces sp. WAC05374]|uniref:DUF4360 domain-containing protein n=1 Tax=unclassified Streptomyces TaxID=2593676 RepID=UPI000F87379B|nr:DUF4360 domain-containing protein [Streptomyces sp. WAC05374]RST12475.1 DUF4360 domain-containing protein [Streptomyces sp. WAC05374]TDF47213.1 DUF4360 domain-containing protein [Streptomyces sp. WAC05374]TDF57471.1 DUF4360 domain-containing protein [Streptomyces sp. WAC05374]TDF61576.1 DUF4360 domain-containing protein [Streptomyces sp. WAC05374]